MAGKAVEHLKCFTNRLVDRPSLVRLFNLLRKLFSHRDHSVLNIALQLVLLLLKTARKFQIFHQGDVELTSQIFYILRRCVLLHVSHVRDLPGRHRSFLTVVVASQVTGLAARKLPMMGQMMLLEVASLLNTH